MGDTARDATFEPLGDNWYAFAVPRSGAPIWAFNPFAVQATTEV
ncbi:hypothetical protein [Paractinoplanes durhamensis]|nr:hypothetical protein [Actinoplanes durhamensis]